MIDAARYISRETRVSIAINTVLSLAFFAGVLGFGAVLPVWGLGHYVFDFAPQGLMIGVMSMLVPGALAGKARREGKVASWPGPVLLPRPLVPRAVVVGLASAIAGVALAGGALAAIGLTVLPLAVALGAKLGFGAVLAAIITPMGLRAALSD